MSVVNGGPEEKAEIVRVALPWPGYFQGAIDAHGWKSLRPFVWDGASLAWPQRTSGGVVPLAVAEQDGWLVVRGTASLAGEVRAEIEAAVARVCFLGPDYARFHALCRTFPDSTAIAEQQLGPMLRSPTAFEDAVKTLLTTNVTWTLTRRMSEGLCRVLGGPDQAFPQAEILADTSLETLRALGLGYRAEYVRDLARSVVSGDLDFAAVERMDDPRPALRTIRGFGPYAVAHLAMLLGAFGEVPFDSWARSLVERHLTRGAAASRADLERHFGRFGEWQALAFRHYPWGIAEPHDW